MHGQLMGGVRLSCLQAGQLSKMVIDASTNGIWRDASMNALSVHKETVTLAFKTGLACPMKEPSTNLCILCHNQGVIHTNLARV